MNYQLVKGVLTRSHPKGRSKIQDKWNSKVYKVVNRRDNIYEIEPTNADDATKIVNRSEIKICPKPKPRTVLPNPRHSRAPLRRNDSASSDDSSDGNDDNVIAFDAPHGPAPVPVAEPDRPQLRRSARLNKGHHSNPHHQPK